MVHIESQNYDIHESTGQIFQTFADSPAEIKVARRE